MIVGEPELEGGGGGGAPKGGGGMPIDGGGEPYELALASGSISAEIHA